MQKKIIYTKEYSGSSKEEEIQDGSREVLFMKLI